MVDRTRKMVKSELTTISLEYLSLGQALAEIQHMVNTYGEHALIEMRCAPYSDTEYLTVVGMVPETDTVMNMRIKTEEAWEAQQAARDLVEYERLKAKFESDK